MRHEGVNFDGAFRVETLVIPISKREAEPLILKHYLRKWPGVVTIRMGLFYKGELMGCAVYALPPRETCKRYGGLTWELARLWVDDRMPRNTETFLIGKSIRYILKTHKNVKALVSYADPSQEHVGRIYRASNWITDGRTDEGR